MHQREVHFANQISSQLQGDKDVDQTAAMAMIEVMPHYDQVLYSMQEMMPGMQGCSKIDWTRVHELECDCNKFSLF